MPITGTGADGEAMEDGDGEDITDHGGDTDIGAAKRGPWMKNLILVPMLMQMLMPGMDITPVHGDMEDGDGVDMPDHTDTDTLFGAVRRGPPTTMEKMQLDQMLMLMLIPGTDITATDGDTEDTDGVDTTDHTDTDTGAVRRGQSMRMNPDPTPMLMLMLMLTMVTGGLGGVAGEAMEDGVDTTDHGDTGEGSKRYSSLVGTKTWESLREDLALSTVNV